tara:strand:+ start:388 stop:1548 length:1161 start_codon:yes stop_codon:yes gene_type:complete
MLSKINFLTSGESHGKALLGIIEGIPSNVKINELYIKNQLSRRQKGYGRGRRMKIEDDYAEIISGVRLGLTLGSPIGLMINNKDWENWKKKMPISKVDYEIKKITLPRPGHADLAGVQKFNFDDIRNVIERSSARETAMRVAIGSICRKVLEEVGIEVGSRVVQIHDVIDTTKIKSYDSALSISKKADLSLTRCLNQNISNDMVDIINKAKEDGDSVGGMFEVFATGLPYGLGSYTQWYKKLNSKIAEMIMSINAFKSIEFGTGHNQSLQFGSEVHDEIIMGENSYERLSNNAGGIEGGMSNGNPIIVRATMKPIPTLIKPLKSVDIQTKKETLAHKERTDSCAVPAASIISESMLCIVLLDTLLEKFGGDSIDQLKDHIKLSGKY